MVEILSHIARLTRYLQRLVLRPAEVDIGSVRLRLPDSARGKVRASIYAEKYKELEAKLLPQYLNKDDVIVEAGAAIGFVGVHCAHIVGVQNIHMVEANKDLLPIITHNFAINGYDRPNLMHGLACVKDEGTKDRNVVPFHIADQFWSSSIIDRGMTVRTDEVARIDLHALFKQTGASVFICDIEGGEFSLLPKLSLDGLRLVIIELHADLATEKEMAQTIQHFYNSGFSLAQSLKGEIYIFKRVEGRPS